MAMLDPHRQIVDEPAQDLAWRVLRIERSILVPMLVGLVAGVLAIVEPFTTAILFGATLATAARVSGAVARRL
jgi:hypothetical protein